MTTNEPGMLPNVAAIGNRVVPLLAVAAFINYADRGNLATAAPLIKDQFGLSATQIGLALWSVATAASGLATGFVTLAAGKLWGASLGHFCGNYAFYFVISWLPLYLVKARGLSITNMAEISAVVYAVYATSSFLTGRWSDRWIQSGASANRVRKTFIILAHAIMALSLLVAAVGDLTISVVSLVCAGVAFVIAAGASALGIVGWGFMIPKVEPLDWEPVKAGEGGSRSTYVRTS